MWEIAEVGIAVVLLLILQLIVLYVLAQLALYFHGEVRMIVQNRRNRRRRRPHDLIPRRDLRLPPLSH